MDSQEIDSRVDDAVAHAGERTPGETPRDRLWGALGALALLMLLLGGALLLLGHHVSSLEMDTARTRAIGCRDLILDGAVLSPEGPCYEPEVLEFYDPEEVEPRGPVLKEDRELSCIVARHLDPVRVSEWERVRGRACEELPVRDQPDTGPGGI